MASYPINLPWLKPPSDPGAEFTAAYRAGASVAMEQQRLQEESQRAAMAAETRAQIAQQDALQTQQKIEIQKSYQQQQIGLRKQALDDAQQKIQASAQDAARRYAGQRAIAEGIRMGGDPIKVALQHPEALGATGIPSLIREQSRVQNAPPDFKASTYNIEGPGGAQIPMVQTSRGHAQPLQQAPTGPIQAQPIVMPDGTVVPGSVGIPGARGGTAHIINTGPKAASTKEWRVQDDTLKSQIKMLDDRAKILDPSRSDEAKELEQITQKRLQLSEQRRALARAQDNPTENSSAPAASKSKRFKYNPQTKSLEPVED